MIRIVFKNALFIPLALFTLLPVQANAQIAGVWNTTGLTKTDVTAIKAPGLVPEHYVDIADDTYNFNSDTSFVGGQIAGFWKQRKAVYTVTVNKQGLESQYRQALLAQNISVNSVKLTKNSFTGTEVDNGLWGTENYEYTVSYQNTKNKTEVVKVVQTVLVAGTPVPKTANSLPIGNFSAPITEQTPVEPEAHGRINAAVNAVLNHLNHQ